MIATLAAAAVLAGRGRVHAQADDPFDPATLPMRWSAPGRPGWAPDAAVGVHGAWTLAGLPRGAWRLDGPIGASPTAGPGVREAEAPRAWFDSLAQVVGEGAAWDGWDGTIAHTRAFLARPAPGRARTVVTVTNGSSSTDRNAALFSRGDARGWIRAGATSDAHDGVGAIGPSGSHLWLGEAGWLRGEHTVSAQFSQRGTAMRQAIGAGEGAKGESGRLRWEWARETRWASASLERTWDARDSRAEAEGVLLESSRRDAQRTGAAFEAGATAMGTRWSARLRADRERVRRPVDATTGNVFDGKAERWWSALRAERALAGGTLGATLGCGWHSVFRGRDEALQVAPEVVWRRAGAAADARVFAGRVVTPLWSDLEPGTAAFLQSTWHAGAEFGARRPGVGSVRLLGVSGVTDGAAGELRYPVADLALRGGLTRAADSRAFSLLSLAAAAGWRTFVAEAEGYASSVGDGPGLARFDPTFGATGRLEASFALFQDDLGVRLVGEASWIGDREALVFDTSDQLVPQSLAGYAAFNASAALALGDAIVRVRGLNLADERRPDVWVDPGTGLAALGSGRQVFFELAWAFTN